MRISLQIVIVLMLLNAGAIMMADSGWTEDAGIAPNPGGDKEVAAANQTASEVNPGSGIGETLFALYNTVAGTVEKIFQLVFAGETMLQNLGVPTWITAFLFKGAYVIAGADLMYVLIGRSP